MVAYAVNCPNIFCALQWVALKPDGTLSGHIYFHHGDESGFTAIRTEDETKSHLKASPKTKRGGR